jgi:hypothetical protein
LETSPRPNEPTALRRPGRALGAILGCGLLTAGCTAISRDGGLPAVIYSSPFGSSQIYPDVPPPAQAPPVTPAERSGTYSGTAVPLDTAGGLCISNKAVRGFKVRGNRVRWGGFRGTIAPDNGLQMVYGRTWVIGQFVGRTFQGQISTDRGIRGPGCSFVMTLEKTGERTGRKTGP